MSTSENSSGLSLKAKVMAGFAVAAVIVGIIGGFGIARINSIN